MYNSQKTALRIKEVAKLKGISITQLQKECELGKNAINQLADSQDGMKSKNLYAIANYLEVSADYLLGRTDEPNGYVNNISTGDINGNYNANMNINNKSEQSDEMTSELIKRFSNLSFDDKLDIFNYIKTKD